MDGQLSIDEKIRDVESLPVKNRRRTDVFCGITLLCYIIALAIILIIVHNQENLNKITYPSDQQGKLCGFDYPEFPYVYYATYTDPTKRLCVNKCPKAGDDTLSCHPTNTLGCKKNEDSKYSITIYDSYLDQGKIGLFCLPTDTYQKSQILKISNTERKYNVFAVIEAFTMCSWISIIIGPICLLFIHFFPYKVVPWAIFIGGIFSFILAFFVFSLDGYLLVKIILCVIFAIISFFSFATLFQQKRRNSLIACSRLLHASALSHYDQKQIQRLPCSWNSLIQLGKPILLILVFFLLYAAWFYIHIKEVLTVWSVGDLHFDPNIPFYTVVGFRSNFLMILVGLQLIWGIFFLREAFGFVAGSHSVFWYYGKQGSPSFWQRAKMMFSYHLGSIAGASFLFGPLYPIEFILSFFSSDDGPDQGPKDKYLEKPYMNSIGIDRQHNDKSGCIKNLFNLIRSQALFFVALTNNNYCMSARYCQFLSANSRFYDYSQTTNRILKVNMHIVPIFIILFISISKMGSSASPYAIIFITFLCFFIMTFFVSYHAQKLEGLLISLYVDEGLNDGYLRHAPLSLQIIYRDDIKYEKANKSFCTLLCNENDFAIKS